MKLLFIGVCFRHLSILWELRHKENSEKQNTVRCEARYVFYSTLQDAWYFIEIYTDYAINIDLSNRGNVGEIKFPVIIVPCVIVRISLVIEMKLKTFPQD
jgi:hypothetical protein